jgi:hypothetical protein
VVSIIGGFRSKSGDRVPFLTCHLSKLGHLFES